MLSHHVRRGGAYDAVPPPLMGGQMMAQQVKNPKISCLCDEDYIISF